MRLSFRAFVVASTMLGGLATALVNVGPQHSPLLPVITTARVAAASFATAFDSSSNRNHTPQRRRAMSSSQTTTSGWVRVPPSPPPQPRPASPTPVVAPKLFDSIVQRLPKLPTGIPTVMPVALAKSFSSRTSFLSPKLISQLATAPTTVVTSASFTASAAAAALFVGQQPATAATATTAAAAAATYVQPTLEAHVLTLLSHLGLDLAVFFAPGMLLLRVLAIVGRLCTMAADYIPDHVIFPEELVFQVGMLTLAWIGLLQAALLPVVSSTVHTMSLRDGRAYLALFQPAGTTWTNFKALSACALDWITVAPGQSIALHAAVDSSNDESGDDEYAYWLYSGAIQVQDAQGEVQHTIRRTPGRAFKHDAGCGLVGERRLLSSKASTGVASSMTAAEQSPQPQHSITVSHNDSPATLLRIHVPSLKLLTDSDANFAESIRMLVFQGMEAKLQAALQQQQVPTPTGPPTSEQPTAAYFQFFNKTASASVGA